MATTYLTRTPSSGAAVQKATFSFWVKKANSGGTPNLFRMYTNAQQYVRIRFESSNKMSFIIINSDSYVVQLITTQVFTDTSGWYNIVCNLDTTQSTASDRAKIYVNGERITAYDTATYPPTQNANITVTPSGTANHIGTQVGDSASYFEGCMSHINFTDGHVYQASEFGETDSTTGEWKINTSPSVTYGTNGFFILKDGNSVTDQSGNSNNFSLGGGTLTKTEDCPDNNFATLNPLNAYYTNSTFSNGNTTFASGSSYSGTTANILLDTGKWYWEGKPISKDGDGDNYVFGIQGQEATATNQFVGSQSTGWMYYGATGQLYNNNSGASWGDTFTAGDIIGVALDCTNNKLYFSKNGVFQNSGNPSGGTGGISITAPASVSLGGYYPSQTFWTGNSGTLSMNFGNGYFGTTAVTSAGTNASGNGIFEYDVPTGYTALSTKGLNL